jgi:radical SAM protein (TIGR01212 family)
MIARRATEKVAERFRSYARYLKDKYGQPVYRVSVDAGFSCPNRGPDRSSPGCLYCDEWGSRAAYLSGEAATEKGGQDALRSQIERSREFLTARYGARLYLLYFQAFSGTYAPVHRLKKTYDYALSCAPFKELIVSTRPDCIDTAVAELLASYRSPDFEVWVELGLQSADDGTLKRINRGHTVADFERAYLLLRGLGLKLTVHLIFGLPGEGLQEILRTVGYLAALDPDGVKIHNLHIPKGAPLFSEYLAGEISVPSDRRHLEYTVRALELLPPATVIMRLTCDTPPARLAAPLGFAPKPLFLSWLRRELQARDTRQGRLYRPGPD